MSNFDIFGVFPSRKLHKRLFLRHHIFILPLLYGSKKYILDHYSIDIVSTKYELCIISSFNVMSFEKCQFQLFVRTAKIYVF